MDRVLITGGAGFIGHHVVRRLLDVGLRIWVYDDLVFGREEYLPRDKRLTFVKGNLLDSALLRATVDAAMPDRVYHLAAIHYIPFCDAHPNQTLRVNVEGTLNLLRTLRVSGQNYACPVVFASSAAVYGSSDAAHTETETPDPIDIYGQSKYFGECLMLDYARQTGAPVRIARLFNVYGPEETNPHVLPAILEQVEQGLSAIKLGRTDTVRDFIHVSDVSSALVSLGQFSPNAKAPTIFNVASGHGISIADVIKLVNCVCGRNVAVESDETRMRLIDRRVLRADISQIRAAIGWEPKVPLVDGIRGLLADRGS